MSTTTHDQIETVARAIVEAAAPAIAIRVVDQLAALLAAHATEAPPQSVDAAMLAARLGVTRGFVYEHADQLGAIRLGDGPRPRLRFDLAQALEAWNARSTSEKSQPTRTPVTMGTGDNSRPPRMGRRASGLPETGSVLAIRGRESGRRAA